jgi:hypothetical protein
MLACFGLGLTSRKECAGMDYVKARRLGSDDPEEDSVTARSETRSPLYRLERYPWL